MGINVSFVDFIVLIHIRSSVSVIKTNINAYLSYQKMYQQINHQYPDATLDELIIKKFKKSKQEINDNETDIKNDDDIDIKDNTTNNNNNNNNNEDSKDDESIEYELCGICREEMKTAKKLPCSHKFHLKCLMGWMRYKHNCPICRKNLTNDNENKNNNTNSNNNISNNNNGSNNINNNNIPRNRNGSLLFRILSLFGLDIIDVTNVVIPRRMRIQNNLNNNIINNRQNGRIQRRQINQLSIEQQIQQINEIFGPRFSQQEIRSQLLRTHSLDRTVDYFLSQ